MGSNRARRTSAGTSASPTGAGRPYTQSRCGIERPHSVTKTKCGLITTYATILPGAARRSGQVRVGIPYVFKAAGASPHWAAFHRTERESDHGRRSSRQTKRTTLIAGWTQTLLNKASERVDVHPRRQLRINSSVLTEVVGHDRHGRSGGAKVDGA